ncbi:MAG: glycosyltransferase family A protein [Patescibacteria group bacterium]
MSPSIEIFNQMQPQSSDARVGFQNKGLKPERPSPISQAVQLLQSIKLAQEAHRDDEKFWEKYEDEIRENFEQKFSKNSENPDVEVIVPVHKNIHDLPALLLSLSRLNTTDLGTIQLSLVMHNNQDDPVWSFVEQLQLPVVIKPLIEPMLSGPYASYNFGLLASTGKKIIVLDADSIVPINWLHNILEPLNKEGTVISAGPRIVSYGPKELSRYEIMLLRLLSTGAYAINSTLDMINRPKAIKTGLHFAGGQCAYRGDVRKILENDYNHPGGDGIVLQGVIDKHGPDAIRYADAPVLNCVDGKRKPRIEYIRRKLRDFFSQECKKTEELKQDQLSASDQERTSRWHKDLQLLSLYVPMLRPLIGRFIEERSLTLEDAVKILVQTANEQGFGNNSLFIDFVHDLGHNPQHLFSRYDDTDEKFVLNAREMMELITGINKRCIKPSLLQKARDVNSAK